MQAIQIQIHSRMLLVLAATLWIGQSLPAQDAVEDAQASVLYSDVFQFGGPTSVGGQIAEDVDISPEFRWQGLQDQFEGWYAFKRRINDRFGLQFEVDSPMLYQVASQSLGETDAGGGLARVYGQWELLGRGTGSPGLLVYKGENRHRIGTAITPFDLGFEAGSIVPTGTFFSEFSFSVTNLFWKQYFFDRQLAVVIGRIDVTDFVDVYALMNPLTHFLNLSFSTNPTIAVPNQGLGAAMGGMLTDHVYFQAGFGDANGQPTRSGFDTFFDEGEFFSYVEFGLVPSQQQIFTDGIHVTLWHSDARQLAQVPEGRGIAFTAQRFICEKWLPFVRVGYSDGDAALMQTTFSTGLGLRRPNNDVAGIGVSWGQPSVNSLRNQFTSELFYRFQLTQFLAVTPDVQLIVDPALNPTVSALGFFGIRMRAVF